MESLYLPAHYDHYCRVYECFCEYSTVTTEEESWLRCRIPDLLSHIDKETTIKVLSIGSGTGLKDLTILQALSKVFPKIQYDIVEPVEHHVKMFEHNVVHHPGMEHIGIKLNCMTFEEFMENQNKLEYYHLIHAIHVVYYVDAATLIRSINKILHPDGFCVVIRESQDGGLTDVRKQLRNAHPGVYNLNLDLVKDVSQVLQDLDVTYSCEKVLWWANVSTVFKDHAIGELLLDMITFVYKFKQTAPIEVQETAMDLLKQICSMENEKHVLYSYSDVYIISKQIK